jgi:hypothetical protein
MSDILGAVRETLAYHLDGELRREFRDIAVHQDWPLPGQALGDFALTVLGTGEADYHFHPPAIIGVQPGPGATGEVTYSYGRVFGLQLELDAWASSKPARDRLVGAVQAALQRSRADVQGLRLARQGGLVLPVGGLLGAPCHYEFTPVAFNPESSSAAIVGEWRARFRGEAELNIVTRQQFALIRRLVLDLGVDGARDSHRLS